MEANFLNQLIKKGYKKKLTFQQRSGMSSKIYLESGCFPEFSVRNNILTASFMMHNSTSFSVTWRNRQQFFGFCLFVCFFFSCCKLCHQAFRLPFFKTNVLYFHELVPVGRKLC